MATAKQQRLYEDIKKGKRVAQVLPAALPALRVWLWRNGYAHTTCKQQGKTIQVIITQPLQLS